MSFLEILLIAFGLSMDAAAVAICKGLCTNTLKTKHYLVVGLWFGIFQGIMPLFGYLLASQFHEAITKYDHWIAFILLALIGINMIRESFQKEDEDCCSSEEDRLEFSPAQMLPMAVATSIDALAVGITFALLANIQIGLASFSIALVTFCMSALGLYIGNHFGQKYKQHAELIGGSILILIGFKILLEHLDILVL